MTFPFDKGASSPLFIFDVIAECCFWFFLSIITKDESEYSKSLDLSLFWSVTSKIRNTLPVEGTEFSPIFVCFAAELTVTARISFFWVVIVVIAAVGTVVGIRDISEVTGFTVWPIEDTVVGVSEGVPGTAPGEL